MCRESKTDFMTPVKCYGFTILPPVAFNPYPSKEFEVYFNSSMTTEVLQRTNDSFAIHLWSRYSQNLKLNKSEEETAYGSIASTNCPKTYQLPNELF